MDEAGIQQVAAALFVSQRDQIMTPSFPQPASQAPVADNTGEGQNEVSVQPDAAQTTESGPSSEQQQQPQQRDGGVHGNSSGGRRSSQPGPPLPPLPLYQFNFPLAKRFPPTIYGQVPFQLDSTMMSLPPPMPMASQHLQYTKKQSRKIVIYTAIDAVLIALWFLRDMWLLLAVPFPLVFGAVGAVWYSKRMLAAYLIGLLVVSAVRLFFMIFAQGEVYSTVIDAVALVYEVFVSCPVSQFWKLIRTLAEEDLHELRKRRRLHLRTRRKNIHQHGSTPVATMV
ncbi:unnamed protein product [Vitrella brassicaformis CCMP3155]|uniref:Uncharacterized protein n=1 Tax=Vitrella brassicaformis (strain CCMP3155) TaxID=1169540 RepID=A0A0G4GCG4_VITBC|nr:unnamed protein product [Vitrella brassicaformis CCMP3155]|eukprot:CEM26961.1 unnamed protein product [Vitrella brassicaformis CCMP3155]